MPTIRQRVTVQEGGRIEITDPALKEGAEAEVVVIVPEPSGDGAPPGREAPKPAVERADALPPPPPLTEMIGAAKGLFETPEEVDAYIRALRDEWD